MNRRLSRGWTIALALACWAGAAHADSSVEYAVKGAYLFKFLPFVDWPASSFAAPNSPITLCIIGADPFGPALDKAVADQHVGAHAIAVRRDAQPGDASCQAAFISNGNPLIEAAALHAFDGKPVLTVTDSSAPAAGVIGFVVEQNHVRFDIDDAAAAQDGLAISSKLLGLARKVTPRRTQP